MGGDDPEHDARPPVATYSLVCKNTAIAKVILHEWLALDKRPANRMLRRDRRLPEPGRDAVYDSR